MKIKPAKQPISKPSIGLHKKQGIWIFSCGEPLSVAAVNRTIAKVRKERERKCLGG
jgi:hypothetical protein